MEIVQRVPQVGRLDWIGLSPARRADLRSVAEAACEVGTGLVGDHHALSGRGKRQVTLVQAEHLPVVARLAGRAEVEPGLLRRNLVVSGINLRSLSGRRFRVGGVLLEATGNCAPCSRMEETIGPGGYQAMRGHGGLTASVIEAGVVRVGDRVSVVDADGA